MKEIKPPQPFENEKNRLFLAGSIEMGGAVDWQSEVVERLKDTEWTILNPRRDHWDNSWEQAAGNPLFRKQVEWELAAQDHADRILMYFSPETKSPISLLELGLFAKTGKMIVVCPPGFWRRGNVEIVCLTYNIPLYNDLGSAIEERLRFPAIVHKGA